MGKTAQKARPPERQKRRPASRGRGASPEKTAQTRQTIVDTALAEFLEKGFANATMEGVARRAGIAKGLTYRYFDTKEALFSAVVEQEIVRAHVDIDDSKRAAGESVEAFMRRTLLASIRNIHKSRADIARLVIVEGARFPALVEIYSRDVINPLLKKIESLAIAGRKTGEFADDRLVKNPHLLMGPLWAGIVNNKFLNKTHPIDIGDLFEAQLDLIFCKRHK